jgi:hypothetical protein
MSRNEWFFIVIENHIQFVGRDSSVGTVTRYRLDGPWIEFWWERDFPHRLWEPLSLLYNGYRLSFLGVKRPGRGADHQLPSSTEVKERVKLCLFSHLGLHDEIYLLQ